MCIITLISLVQTEIRKYADGAYFHIAIFLMALQNDLQEC